MGNCNSQRLVEGLGDKCGSAGALKRRRARLRRTKEGRHSSSSSSSSSSSAAAAAAAAAAKENQTKLPGSDDNASKMKQSSNDQVKVIDLSSDLAHDAKRELEKRRPEATGDAQNDAQRDEAERQRRLEKLKEGLDFIETEEDVKAVEAATLKIQSTFRGKKIRSKISTPKQDPTSAAASQKATADSAKQQAATGSNKEDNEALSEKVRGLQLQDNNDDDDDDKSRMEGQQQKSAASAAASGLPEEEAERAATKIQAGFKGYKTRKELEGKLHATGSAGGGQQGAGADE